MSTFIGLLISIGACLWGIDAYATGQPFVAFIAALIVLWVVELTKGS